MRLLFSESEPDYTRYRYPYVVWAVPDEGDTPADFFEAGFLPASPAMDCYYLARQLRLPLAGFKPNSENRRILKRGARWTCRLVPKTSFDYSPGRKAAWLAYAAERFGEGVMHEKRLDGLMNGAVITHLLVFEDAACGGRESGTVLMFLSPTRVAYYYYAFYDLNAFDRNLGMVMMTRAACFFAEHGYRHLHLGTCYSERALYKTQFNGIEFFNGLKWTGNIQELKHLIRRDGRDCHVLQDPVFQAFEGGLPEMLRGRSFRLA